DDPLLRDARPVPEDQAHVQCPSRQPRGQSKPGHGDRAFEERLALPVTGWFAWTGRESVERSGGKPQPLKVGQGFGDHAAASCTGLKSTAWSFALPCPTATGDVDGSAAAVVGDDSSSATICHTV